MRNPIKKDAGREYEAFSCKVKLNTCTVCEIGLFTEDVGEFGVLAISRMSL